MLLAYWRQIAAALAILAAFGAGWTVNGWRYQAKEKSALVAAQKAREAMERRAAASATEYEETRSAIAVEAQDERVKVRTIYRDKAIPVDCALPADALGVLREARDRANATAAGQSGAAVP